MPALNPPQLVDALNHGDIIEIDTNKGTIKTENAVFTFPPLPPEVVGIFDAGGLIPYTRKKLGIK